MFCMAGYNVRRQRVLKGKTPDLVVAERLTAKPALAKDKPAGRARSCDITKARLIAENAEEVSQPDNYEPGTRDLRRAPISFAYLRLRRLCPLYRCSGRPNRDDPVGHVDR
jgi:hypothetical protein